MNCPHGHGTLLMSERQGVEIDYCPECRGVWLDRGELDKIVERSATEDEVRSGRDDRDDRDRDRREQRPDDRYRERDDRNRDRDDRDRDQPRYGAHSTTSYDPKYAKKKKRKSFLEDLFEF
jgi:Zn-finger nucleic acid-binding protein